MKRAVIYLIYSLYGLLLLLAFYGSIGFLFVSVITLAWVKALLLAILSVLLLEELRMHKLRLDRKIAAEKAKNVEDIPEDLS